MQALSIKQPHIDRIISGKKTFEIRSWKTKFRGDILLCASSGVAAGYEIGMVTGQALAIATLSDIVDYDLSMQEAAMADFLEEHYAWIFTNIRKIEPFQVKGKMGLFSVEL